MEIEVWETYSIIVLAVAKIIAKGLGSLYRKGNLEYLYRHFRNYNLFPAGSYRSST